jgi:dihydroorotase-like cyclic amidohydrolase
VSRFDLAVVNGTLVIPHTGLVKADLGVKDGRIAAIADKISTHEAETVVDANGKAVFPGAVDSHYHVGIYRPFSQDAESESRSSLIGGVTTLLSYFRTGHHYLNTSGPYRTIFPEVLELAAGHFYTDYGFHLAIMTAEQLLEVDDLVEKYGVGSFKFYMFYKGLNLSADSTRGNDYTMADNYDLGHLYLLMEKVSAAARKHAGSGRIALSLHCENPELIRVFIEKVKEEGLQGLKAYSRARPPLTEHLSILEAVLLAEATGCPVNLLHLSSRQALEAGIRARREHPSLDIVLETTLHHLTLTCETAGGVIGKVNPPIRGQEDVNYLWEGIASGEVDTVVSDHACCMEEEKKDADLWGSLPGFGGSSLLYPTLLSEGFHKRNVPLTRISEIAAANPARHFGLFPQKGGITVGADADFAVIDLNETQTVTPELLQSAQKFTPFRGQKLKGWPSETIRRGEIMMRNSRVIGQAGGRYIRRPVALHGAADRRFPCIAEAMNIK